MAQAKQDLIYQVPDDVSMRITYNGKYLGKYDMLIMMEAEGICCAVCGKEAKEDIFYCEQDNIFMHKQCLIDNHKICNNASIIEMQNRQESTFHEDRAVDVRFIDKS